MGNNAKDYRKYVSKPSSVSQKIFIKNLVPIHQIKPVLTLDYPQHSKFVDPVNKKVIRKLKDEFLGKIISQFIGLKSKMYSLIKEYSEEVIKAKLMDKNIIKNIRQKEYTDDLFNKNW